MRVTQVSIRASEAATEHGRPELTPELLASCAARYSRNNEGLEAILAKIDPENMDRSVDSIFKMIDYGHQSIADMVPVAMFLDEVSIFLAYLIWSVCPTAGGQESSTRYIRLSSDGLVAPEEFGLAPEDHAEWHAFMKQCFEAYETSLGHWEEICSRNPDLTRIPKHLLEDKSEKAVKQVARMKRNYAFDRARYFLPVAAKTNMMLIMSARGWVQLCQYLFSHWLPEAQHVAAAIREELTLVAPRLVRHAKEMDSFRFGIHDEFQQLSEAASKWTPSDTLEAPCNASVELFPPNGISDAELAAGLEYHDNRYAYTGDSLRRTAIRFAWSAVAIAEIRDLNRHRTGQKYCPLLPLGFYCASDQVPSNDTDFTTALSTVGKNALQESVSRIAGLKPSYIAYGLLGLQYQFEHTTTLDKFVYEAELRTGTGAHYRYASHLSRVIDTLQQSHPLICGKVRVGTAEPE